MKKILLSIMALFVIIGMTAQENKDEKQLKKEKEEAALQSQFDSTLKLVQSKQFVLEAEFLQGSRGRRVYVPSNLNFIKVDTTISVIQTGNNSGYGYNGVGGATAEGRITKFKLKTNDKKKSIYIEMSVISNIGIYDVFMQVDASGSAYASLTSLRRGRLQYDGKIVPLDESMVFKGRTP